MPALSYSSLYFSDRLHGWILGTVLSLDQQRVAATEFFSTSDGGDHWLLYLHLQDSFARAKVDSAS